MRKTIYLAILLLSLCALANAQTPKPDTLIVSNQSRLEALQIIQSAYQVLGSSVTTLKTDEAINLKKGLESVYQLLNTPVQPKKEEKPVTKK